MAYQATTAASTGDVLDKIRLFAIAQGWTENRWRDSTETRYGKELCISHTDAGYFNFVHDKKPYSGNNKDVYDISFTASSGYDSTKKTYEQADRSAPSRLSIFEKYATKTRNFYLFGTTQYIYVVQELKANFYVHLCFGSIDKAWSYTGGQFVTATWWNWHVRSRKTRIMGDIDAISVFSSPAFSSLENFSKIVYGLSLRCDFAEPAGVNWHNTHPNKQSYSYASNPRPNDGFIEGGYPINRNGKWRTPYGDLSAALPQTMPALSPMLPLVPAILKGNNHYLCGQWPDVRYVNMRFINPKQEITLGSDIWVCFPCISKHVKNQPTGLYDKTSGAHGIAYKK